MEPYVPYGGDLTRVALFSKSEGSMLFNFFPSKSKACHTHMPGSQDRSQKIKLRQHSAEQSTSKGST